MELPGQLIRAAQEVQGEFTLRNDFSAGSVGAALMTKAGNIYTGICIDLACGIGFCAEHSAVADMLKHREREISWVVAVGSEGSILPPCGRCREMLLQVHKNNRNTRVILPGGQVKTLSALMPDSWLGDL